MLENIAAQILNRYIGRYVENINTKNLSIGLLQGAVELENLPLRKDAFDDLDLPGIVLKSGHIGKVVLRIKSYKSIKEPWIIEIHGLRLVVGPGETTRTVNKEEEKKGKKEKKSGDLQALEEKWRAKHGQKTSLYSVWYAYSSSIITTIMENLQFEIHDVHVRYEDDVTLPQKFACGIVIKNLTSKSTDEKWVPTMGERSRSDMMYKLLQLDGFSIYWDSESEMLGDLSPDKLDEKLQKWEQSDSSTSGNQSTTTSQAQFLLSPVCGEAKLTKNSSPLPLRLKTTPRILLDVLLGEISLHLSHTQYKQAIALASELSRSEKRNIYKDGRPIEEADQNPRAWWKWAFNIHMKRIKKVKERSSKPFVLNRAKNNVEYVRLYERIIKSKMELEKVQAGEITLLEVALAEIENDLTFHEIQILREVVFERTENELLKKKNKEKEGKSQKKSGKETTTAKGWGSWLRGWASGWSADNPVQKSADGDSQAEINDESEKDEDTKPEVDLNLYDSVYKDLNQEEIYEMFGEELSEQDTNDTFLKRDSVFLKLNFKLDAGTLTLHEDGTTSSEKDAKPAPFIGIEFIDVSTTSEWRPRYQSSQVKTDLGGLYVKDLSSRGSCFPDLIKPLPLQPNHHPHSPRESSNVMSSSIKGIFDLLSSNKVGASDQAIDKSPVFSMLYQNQPRSSKNRFTNRLEIVSAPIVITFLPNLVERVKEFFKFTDANADTMEMEDGISAAALEKYEIWKQQSQSEIKRTVKRMMDGKITANVYQDQWAVTLNISAPEIILPEDVNDPKTNIVIANLGHMTFKNHNEDDLLKKYQDRIQDSKVAEEILEEEEEEDNFVTPPDTPTNEEDDTKAPGLEETETKVQHTEGISAENLIESPSQQKLNEKLFYERMYEQYQMHFTDLQVLVARHGEKWEATRTEGKGPHHLIERFSVDLQMQRRVVQTLDPKCPAVKLKGNLPSLTIHLSHDKVHSLFRCLDKISQTPESTSPSKTGLSPRKDVEKTISDTVTLAKVMADRVPARTSEEKALSKQLLCQFCMNEVSVLLEESPASILSVLEIRRIQAEFTKRPFDHSSLFSIHSMLLIDTKQELGHDYELLLASHRNVKMDLGSGNILDSGTTSPMSDGEQHPVMIPRLSSVAKSLEKTSIFSFTGEEPLLSPNYTGSGFGDSTSMEDGDDLITVEWKVVQSSKNSTRKSSLTVEESASRKAAKIKFNSLDLVLNLKTWVALLDFLHRLKPADDAARTVNFNEHDMDEQSTTASSVNLTKPDLILSPAVTDGGVSNGDGSETEVFIEFHKLNILLMRHIEADKVIGRKVATLLLQNTIVHATLGDNIKRCDKGAEDFTVLVSAHGSVGGLALQDLTNAVRDEHENFHGMQVLCLGNLTDEFSAEILANSSSNTSAKERDAKSRKSEAFKFDMKKGKRHGRKKSKDDDDAMQFQMETDETNACSQEEVILNLHLASVLYMHTPRLVAEILALSDEAGDIINAKMTPDIKQSYKDIAFSLMDKSIAVLGKSSHQIIDGVDDSGIGNKQLSNPLPPLFKLMIDMQSPIVALPKCHGSFELLVGNLGKITVKNGHALGRFREYEDAMDFLSIEITDMSFCSRRQVEEEMMARKSPGIQKRTDLKKTSSGPSLTKLKQSASSRNTSFSETQILHDTSIRLTVTKKPFTPPPRKQLDLRFPRTGEDGVLLSDEVYDGPINDKKMCVEVKMTLPLTVTLSKAAYEQLLKTLDHISYGGNIDVDDIEELEGSLCSSSVEGSLSSKDAMRRNRSALDSVTSQQSTPSHNREFKLFSAPGLEITPSLNQSQSETSTITNRKYTPVSADISIPQIEVQLTQDFSGGEQGVVKVTLEGFSAKFEKENRSTTHLDLTLGSLDVEDLLREENSPHRHIVSSLSPSSRAHAKENSNLHNEYLSTSCPPFASTSSSRGGLMTGSLPSERKRLKTEKVPQGGAGVFRPYASGAFGISELTHKRQTHRRGNSSNEITIEKMEEEPWTPPSSPIAEQDPVQVETLVRIRAFLVDGNSTAYKDVYDRTNRRIDVDFNSLDCKINLQTWVVLLDFFGIGTSPKKTYQLDPKTEEEYNWDRRLAVNSYYENQPNDFINSEIDFKVRSFSVIFNKDEYEFVKANMSKLGMHVQIRDSVLGVSGQLGSLSVSDLGPNGNKYKERFVFGGEKALDFDITKYDDYDEKLEREYDIKVQLRMSAICYIHTHRFHQELLAYLLHFQQLQEVLGRMRAASVGQVVLDQSRRQARISLDIEADSPVLLIPESSNSDRLVVADLGNMTVKNSFKWNGDPGTLSQDKDMQMSKEENPDTCPPLSPSSRKCLLDVLHADLDQMDLYTAVRYDKPETGSSSHRVEEKSVLTFSSFVIRRDRNPLLREKCKLNLQIERNLEKETMVRNVPDTSVSGQLSSVYCTVDLQQYWLVRGILDHNLGEPIPEFPQPTAFLQPSSIQTVLSGSVYTGMSIDMRLLNVSVELLKQHKLESLDEVSLARLNFVKSRLSFRSFSDQTKTVNLSCEAFVASDTRWKNGGTSMHQNNLSKKNVFSTVLGPSPHSTIQKKQSSRVEDSLLQFELQFREGPDFLHFTALLVDMRVYIIADWLSDVYQYLIVNPVQEWCDSLRIKAAESLEKYGQVVPGQEQQKETAAFRDEQFKLNATNTDFVLVENPSVVDSDAVILRMTAVLHHNPILLQDKNIRYKASHIHRKIVNCTLQSLEVFSCQLDVEKETELSIVDPVKVNIEIDALTQVDLTADEITFDPSLLDRNKLEVQIAELNTRVSYNDLLLFQAIMKSLSTGKADKEQEEAMASHRPIDMESTLELPEESIESLMQLGYGRKDVVKALQEEDGDVQHAGEWLLENAKMLSESEIQKLQEEKNSQQKYPLDIGKMFLQVNSMCVCLIDDCADCDVPLAEFSIKHLNVQQNLSLTDPEKVGKVETCFAGKAHFSLAGDYYNRLLSLWEPYLEPWRCTLGWNYAPGATLSSTGKWDVKVQTSDRLDITVTSTLIETVKKTKESWTRSFTRTTQQSENLIDFGPGTSNLTSSRKRKEFVPYVLRNLTGLPLRFTTHVSAIQQPSSSHPHRGGSNVGALKRDDSWISVMPGDSHPFRFDRFEKQRHKRSEEIILHQIITKVGDWETLPPVTISKVGIYFRHTTEEIVKSSSVYRRPDPVRVVFAVASEGSAQKVVTVRSALVIRSKVKIPVQIHLMNGVEHPIIMPRLEPGGVQYIPLQLTHYGIKIRPVFSSKHLYRPSTQTIHWNKMNKDDDKISDMITCSSESNKDTEPFRFSVCVKKKSYPLYEEVSERLMSEHAHPPCMTDGEQHMPKYGYVPPHMPGHTIIILPPVVVSNLLPCDLHYYFKDTPVAGKLSPGQDATLHILHLVPGSINHPPLLLGCGLEGFKDCRELTVPHVERNSQMRMVMLDHQDRTLILNVRVFWRLGCSVKISIMSGYWIVNKTGLPIVIKQEGAKASFAGQYAEHERARSLVPLLFSYSDRELPYLCTMRLGKETSQEMALDQLSKYPQPIASTPYCQSFSIDGGTCTRNLTMVNHDNRPSRVYYIGVGVRRGWGRYMHTHIVTLAPRFLLINMTKERTLNFAQLHATSFTTDAAGLNRHLTIRAGSSVVFHWPRADLERLLSTRLSDETNCRWSGGFVIDRIDAFHVHLRIFGERTSNHSVFLRVEITLVDATYRVMFFDGDISSCPSPLRIDNISAAPLVIRQCDTDEGLQISVPPECQVPYACDQPCLPPLIDCKVQGASDSVYLNMDIIGEEKVLYYENFIYIVVGQKTSSSLSRLDEDPYVLAVQEVQYDQSVDGTGHLVTLEKRETGRRSQLWRMTNEGFLRHEGSSPPSGMSKYPSPTRQGLVLDIAELAMSTDIMPLTVRRFDPKRKSQYWNFTDDGRLCSGFKNLCVQVTRSNQVGLAPYVLGALAMPNQHCTSEKMISGSGVLSLKVVRDGPTRVIRVLDIKQKRAGMARNSNSWAMMSRQPSSNSVDPQPKGTESSKHRLINLNIDMAKGIGFSLISNAPEELLYLAMSGVRLELSLDERTQKFTLKIQKIQIDNQLLGGRPPVMLHPYKSSSNSGTSSSSTDPKPAFAIEAIKLPSNNNLYEIYHNLTVSIGRICLKLEETLLLKLIQFMNSGISPEADLSLLDEAKMDLIQNSSVSKIASGTMRRYYFDKLIFAIQPMQLSVYTTSMSRMDLDLKAVKQASSLVLIQFERAPVSMQPYARQHVFESTAFIIDEATKHFTDQLRGHAAKILGSVDFLGNPIGLLSDLRAGFGSFVRGSPSSLVMHVTHGFSNSAAKVADTLSSLSGGITMDKDHEEKRRAIKANPTNASDHFVAGLQSLGTGLVGGLTSIVTQTVKGASNQGTKGFFTGLGKGLVGTVTKPVTGVLDFASETASFVRDTSMSSDMIVQKVRLPRTCHSFQGCLECFSESRAENQQFLYQINGQDYDEWLYSLIEIKRKGRESMLILITNKRVYLMKNNEPDPEGISLHVNYQDLIGAKAVKQNSEWSLELAIKMDHGSRKPPGGSPTSFSSSSGSTRSAPYHHTTLKKPRIICHSEATAKRICEHVNYANMLASEQSETLPIHDDDTENDKAFYLEV